MTTLLRSANATTCLVCLLSTEALKARTGLIKPAYVKFALIPSSQGTYSLGFEGETFDINDAALAVVLSLMKENAISIDDTPALLDHLKFLHMLYNHQALEFMDRAT